MLRRGVPVLLVSAAAVILSGCFAVALRTVYRPVYLTYDALRRSIVTTPAEPMSVTGKIYVKDQYVYVNEVGKGVHVVDDSDATSPVQLAFIPIPGSVDMAIKGNILYADSYVDLVAIDISDPASAHEVARVQNAFPYPEPMPLDGWWYPGGDVYEETNPDSGIVLGWEAVGQRIVAYDTRVYAMDATGGAEGGGTGTGGSMARFTVVGDYLYALHQDSIVFVDVSAPAAPVLVSGAIPVGWNIETIFAYEDKLFIGSTTGMFIFDNSAPPALVQLSALQHVTSCDPVVVQGGRAYVTLRAGASCGGLDDQLLIIDVSDPTSPVQIASHPLEGPYGLAVDGARLFVCDGESGLKVLDVSDPEAASLPVLATVTGYQTYDVILVPARALAIVVGPSGLYQYDTSGLSQDPPALAELSHLVVTPPPEETEDGGTSEPGSPGEGTR